MLKTNCTTILKSVDNLHLSFFSANIVNYVEYYYKIST